MKPWGAPGAAQRGNLRAAVRRVGEVSVPAQTGGDHSGMRDYQEKRVSSLFANGPERKMQRQVVSTMQSWDARPGRGFHHREVVRFVTWVFQGVRMTDEGVRGPGLLGTRGQAGPAAPLQAPWGEGPQFPTPGLGRR